MPVAAMPQYADSTQSPSGNPLDAVNADPTKGLVYKAHPKAMTDEDQKLTVEQAQYQSYLEIRMTRAQKLRDRNWPEFSNKTYLQQYQDNEKISITYLEPKKNEDDVQIASGTIESKLNVLLAHIDNLNLTPEIRAFDKDSVPLRDLGTAFTDIFDKLAEHDGGLDTGDAEKRMNRQKELLKQGTVFVQDKWCSKYKSHKVLKRKYDGTFNFDAWDNAWKPYYTGPDRVLLYGPNVYLGDITQFAMDEQPYVFTVEQMSYDSAKGLYGKFANWEYVKPGMQGNVAANLLSVSIGARTIFDGKFRLTTLKDSSVEVIKYQDPTRDEFQIMVNGIMLLPIGFPLSAVSPGGKINIAKQILYPINPQFAYGKAFVASGDVYELSRQLDEILRLIVLKFRKSVTPPYINTSGKIISRRVLAPGNISQGISPQALQMIGQESQGVTGGEFQVYQEILNRIEQSTVSPVFQGQFGKSNTTATEVLEVQRQARLALGIIISACTLLEVKLAYLRLPLVIGNYFEPIKEVMGTDGKLKRTYRAVSRETDIPNAGNGLRRVIPIDGELPPKELVRSMELMDEQEYGYASSRIYLSVKNLRNIQLTWRAVVIPKERESSAYEKILFREMLNDASALYQMGSVPNLAGLESEFAKKYEIDRNRLFGSASENIDPMMELGGGKPPGQANISSSPTAAPGMSQQVGAGA